MVIRNNACEAAEVPCRRIYLLNISKNGEKTIVHHCPLKRWFESRSRKVVVHFARIASANKPSDRWEQSDGSKIYYYQQGISM